MSTFALPHSTPVYYLYNFNSIPLSEFLSRLLLTLNGSVMGNFGREAGAALVFLILVSAIYFTHTVANS